MSEAGTIIDNKELEVQIDKMQRDGQLKKAIELCQSALKSDPTNPELHIRLGDLYLEWHLDIYQINHYIDEAITEYQRALESNFNSAIIHYKIGVALYHKGDLDKAINHLNIAIQYNNTHAEAYFMIARIFAKKERYAEAVQYLHKSIECGKTKVSRAYYLLYLLTALKSDKFVTRFFRSNIYLLASILTVPFDKDAQREILTKLQYIKFIPVFIKGYHYEKNNNIHKAIETYLDAIEKAPGFLPLYILLGDVYKNIGKISDATSEYKMALMIDSSNTTAYKALCSIYEEQGDYDNAILAYKKLIEMHPGDAVYHSNLANIYYLKGNFKEAISCYQTAITLNPNKKWTSIIAQTLGYVMHESKENYDAAISAYQSAFLLNPNDIDIYVSLGSAFYDKGDYNNALTIYRAALEMDPNNARIHCNLGYLLWGKGIIDESIKEYELAIKLDPSYDIAYNNLGVIYLDDLGHIQKAEELFKQAIKANPNYALAYYNLARGVAIKGDKPEAARLYQIALDLNTYTNELDKNEIKAKINELFDS